MHAKLAEHPKLAKYTHILNSSNACGVKFILNVEKNIWIVEKIHTDCGEKFFQKSGL